MSAVDFITEAGFMDVIRGISTGYEIHINLARAIFLHEHQIDHIAHLCPAQAAGIGKLLRLKQEVDNYISANRVFFR